MTMHPRFAEASQAADESLDFIITAENLAVDGKQDDAKRCLKALLGFELMYGDVFLAMKNDFARVADDVICRNGPDGPVYYSSAHNAVYSLWGTLGTLVGHPDFVVRADLRDWLGINTSLLTASLCRERAKLLDGVPLADELLNEARVEPEDVPPEYREKKEPNGEILAPPYLIGNPEWPFENPNEFTRAYHDTKLTRRIKVRRSYAYLYDELCALWRDNSLKD